MKMRNPIWKRKRVGGRYEKSKKKFIMFAILSVLLMAKYEKRKCWTSS